MSKLKKIAIGFGLLISLCIVGSLAFVWWIGGWRALFPTDAYETTAPVIADDFGAGASLRVLVYSKTNSFRHIQGIEAAHALFDEIGKTRGWAVFHGENSALLGTASLARFDVVVFANASGNHASDQQDTEFRTWLESGGGWVGIHAAGDSSHEGWTWYAETLIGGRYIGHIMGPQTQEARVVVEARNHPITRGLPAEFRHAEEWYSWDRSARAAGFDVLLSVDESTYSPWVLGFGPEKDISMKDHPVVWSGCVERGRAVYSAMGHWADAYQQDYTRRLLENAVEWAGGAPADACVAKVESGTD